MLGIESAGSKFLSPLQLGHCEAKSNTKPYLACPGLSITALHAR